MQQSQNKKGTPRQISSNESVRWKLRMTVSVGGGLCVLIAIQMASFYITSYVLFRLHYHPSHFVNHMISSILCILILLTVGFVTSRFALPKQIAFFQSIIEVIRQMSKGNFDVSIDIRLAQANDRRFSELVHSINDMAEELGQLEQMRQEFISNVSHEIQSPLTSIAGFAQALKNQNLSLETSRHYLDIIETESYRLSKLSDNLMKLTSLESQQHPFNPNEFRLDTQLRHVLLSLEPQWTGKNIQLDVSLENLFITAEEDLLSQVWMNLLSNAIKFTPPNGVIRVALRNAGSKAIITISDTGIGIAEADYNRIFERFYKVDKSRNRSAGGSGLGLAIVKKILDLHSGTIHIESQLLHGSTFTIELPVHYQPMGN